MEQETDLKYDDIPFVVRLRFWLDFARGKHRREMHFLRHTAKLGKKPRKVDDRWHGWNNVIKHQVAQAIAIRVLAQALNVIPEMIERHETIAFVHDARKRLDQAPYDFSDSELNEFEMQLREITEEVDPDGSLRMSTGEEFFLKVLTRTQGESIDEKIENTSRCELLQYYIDSVFLDGTIVSPQERIDRTEERKPHLNEDPEWTQTLGMKYWNAERIVVCRVQRVIWKWLMDQNVKISSPNSLPDFIRIRMNVAMARSASRSQ